MVSGLPLLTTADLRITNALLFPQKHKNLPSAEPLYSQARKMSLTRLVTPHGVGRCRQSRQRGRLPSGALRIAPCFFTSFVCLHLPQAAANSFAQLSHSSVFAIIINCRFPLPFRNRFYLHKQCKGNLRSDLSTKREYRPY